MISNHNTLERKSISPLLWMSKQVTLHNEIGVVVAEGICCSINSKLVIWISGLLGDTHIVVQISKNLKEDEFLDD